MNRRTLLTGMGAAWLTGRAAETRVRIGFLGGSHAHAWAKVKTVRELPQFEVVGLWEEDPNLRKKYEEAGVRVCSRDQLLGDSTVQAIAVESDVMDHSEHARMALEAGKHVHVEKAPATTMDAFRALVSLAARRQRLMQMGYMWRYHPAMNAALEAARRGWLGDVYQVRATINTLVPPDSRPGLARLRGGLMFELGCHLIDVMVRLMGRPDKVTPYLRKDGGFSDALADNTLAILEWPHTIGTVVSAALQFNAGSHRSFEVLGTNGTAVVQPIEPPGLRIDLAKASGPYKATVQTVPLPPYTRYIDDFKEFASAIQAGKPLSITPQEDLLVQETLLRACDM
jgi:predicted dehydrogenase